MKSTLFISATITVALTTGCTPLRINTPPHVKLLKGNTIKYRGYINLAGYEQLQKNYANSSAQIAPVTLKITSQGGDPYAGMMMGRFIKDKKIRVDIKNYCFSACANYIFPAATNKYLEKNAIVGFHQTQGRSLTEDKEVTMEERLAQFDTVDAEKVVKIHYNGKDKSPDKKIESKMSEQLPSSIQKNQYFPEYIANCGNKRFHFDSMPTANEILLLRKNIEVDCYNYKIEQEKVFYNELNVDFRLPKMGITKLKQAQTQSNGVIAAFYYDQASLEALGVKNVVYAKGWDPMNNRYYKKMVKVNLSDWQK